MHHIFFIIDQRMPKSCNRVGKSIIPYTMKTIKNSLILFGLILSVQLYAQPTNIAQGKSGTMTQPSGTTTLPATLFDGITVAPGLRFGTYSNPVSLKINLGNKFDLTSVTIFWGTTCWADGYHLSTSPDGVTWTLWFPVTSNPNHTIAGDCHKFTQTGVQYILIDYICSSPNTNNANPTYSVDIFDIQATGTPSEEVNYKKLSVWNVANFYSDVNVTGQLSTGSIVTSGNVSIGCSSGLGNLNVNGKIQAKSIEILTAPCADYVFEKNYKLMNLHDLSLYVAANKHLPEVPSAEEFKANGTNVTEMNELLLKKVEELTLYVIDLNKQLQDAKTEIGKLNAKK